MRELQLQVKKAGVNIFVIFINQTLFIERFSGNATQSAAFIRLGPFSQRNSNPFKHKRHCLLTITSARCLLKKRRCACVYEMSEDFAVPCKLRSAQEQRFPSEVALQSAAGMSRQAETWLWRRGIKAATRK